MFIEIVFTILEIIISPLLTFIVLVLYFNYNKKKDYRKELDFAFKQFVICFNNIYVLHCDHKPFELYNAINCVLLYLNSKHHKPFIDLRNSIDVATINDIESIIEQFDNCVKILQKEFKIKH